MYMSCLRRWQSRRPTLMHVPSVTGLAVSHDSALLVSISHDKSVKVFDVASFDMMAMLRLPFVPACAEWISKARSPPAM